MDPRLLRLYNDELTHLREVGGEFAREFPKIAGRLGMEGTEVADPYVERLLEGFAFLSARVQLKLDAEHPRLISHLLESIYPNFLAPVPSMMVARPTWARGIRCRGTACCNPACRAGRTPAANSVPPMTSCSGRSSWCRRSISPTRRTCR
jgi:hypothetical protein